MSDRDRTVEIIDAEIKTIKANNPNWFADTGDKALITALTVEKNQLAHLGIIISIMYVVFYLTISITSVFY